jgi:cytochrome c551/c552
LIIQQGFIMKNNLLAVVAITAALGVAAPALAGDADLCLDCHEPAEDWEGLSAHEVLATAKDTSIERHADNADLNDEQLKAIVAELLAE